MHLLIFFSVMFLGLITNAGLVKMSNLVSPVLHRALPNSDGDNCNDYSGKWTGKCMSNNIAEEGSIEISQFGCDAWFLNSAPDFLYLNGKKVIADTDFAGPSAPYTREQIFETNWEDGKIKMKISQKNSKSSNPTFTSVGVFALEKEQLIVNWSNSKGEVKTCTLSQK